MQENKGKIAANRTHNFRIGRGPRGISGKNVCSVANDRYACRLHSLGNNPRAHVLTKDDDTIGMPQCPAIQSLPYTHEEILSNDVAAHGHIRIEIANVV